MTTLFWVVQKCALGVSASRRSEVSRVCLQIVRAKPTKWRWLRYRWLPLRMQVDAQDTTFQRISVTCWHTRQQNATRSFGLEIFGSYKSEGYNFQAALCPRAEHQATLQKEMTQGCFRNSNITRTCDYRRFFTNLAQVEIAKIEGKGT